MFRQTLSLCWKYDVVWCIYYCRTLFSLWLCYGNMWPNKLIGKKTSNQWRRNWTYNLKRGLAGNTDAHLIWLSLLTPGKWIDFYWIISYPHQAERTSGLGGVPEKQSRILLVPRSDISSEKSSLHPSQETVTRESSSGYPSLQTTESTR